MTLSGYVPTIHHEMNPIDYWKSLWTMMHWVMIASNQRHVMESRWALNQNGFDLVVRCFPLVNATAVQLRRRIAPQMWTDDLVAGVLALDVAATRYRSTEPVDFPTFAKQRVRGAILDSLRQRYCVQERARSRGLQNWEEFRTSLAALKETGFGPAFGFTLIHLRNILAVASRAGRHD